MSTVLKRAADVGYTVYSDEMAGDDGNYDWSIRVDYTARGYVGITQYEGGCVKDRVLLTEAQWRAAVRFVEGAPERIRRAMSR